MELFAGGGTFPGGGEKQPEEQVLVCVLQDVHDGVVELGEHHEVHGQAGAAVLRGRVTREPGQRVVLLQHEPAGEAHTSQPALEGAQWALLDLHPDRAASVLPQEESHWK